MKDSILFYHYNHHFVEIVFERFEKEKKQKKNIRNFERFFIFSSILFIDDDDDYDTGLEAGQQVVQKNKYH